MICNDPDPIICKCCTQQGKGVIVGNEDVDGLTIPTPESRWKHFKGNIYEVDMVALCSDTCTLKVIYHEIIDVENSTCLSHVFWSRSLKEWNQEVDLPDGTRIARFSPM